MASKNNTKTETATPAAFVPTFEDAAVPAVTRESKPNPYAEVAKFLADNRDKAKVLTIPADMKASQVRLMQLAGKANGVTIRNKPEDAGNGNVRLTIWAVDAIKRPRKGK